MTTQSRSPVPLLELEAQYLALPIYPELTEAQQAAVVEEIAGMLGG